MGLLNTKTIEQVLTPIRRFAGGWEPMGAITREADKRSIKELTTTIDAYAQTIPEVKAFAEQIKKLKPKHMGTIADTIELSNHHEMLMTGVDLKQTGSRGISIREALIQDMVEASKSNPEAMELVDAVINNTDSLASKYALAQLSGGILKNKEMAVHMSETAKVVPDIAKETLGGGYLGDFSKEANFMDWIKTMVNPDTKPNKINTFFKDLVAFTEKRHENFRIDVNNFLSSNASREKMAENYKVLPEVVEMLGNKVENFNIVDFVTKNTNLY